jgi:tetratricopeptide (TPR) repeat protein
MNTKGILVLAAAFAFAASCGADPGHEVRIEDINAQIAANPNLPDLYFQRSVNYREINRLAEARADLDKCLTLQAGFLPASRELARLDELENHRKEGIERLEKAIAAAPADAAFHLPGCYALLADMLLKDNSNEKALVAAGKGISLSQEMTIDLYLLRAEAQRRLGKNDDRVRDLAGATEKLKSFVLRIACIEALIDAGRSAEVLPEIQKEIDTSRYKSSWLIRRARVRLHDGKKDDAIADLQAALTEIEPRIRPEHPDLSLVCDRALIHALQGKREEAAKELADAKTRGADGWMTRVLESVLSDKK